MAKPATGEVIATIEEEVRLTAWGVISLILLILSVIGSLMVSAGATTVFQQIEAGVSLISGLLLFGLGVALGRRRTYRVVRSGQPPA